MVTRDWTHGNWKRTYFPRGKLRHLRRLLPAQRVTPSLLFGPIAHSNLSRTSILDTL